ncbi:MAG: class B sortase [Eggerthellaceae bacterium]
MAKHATAEAADRNSAATGAGEPSGGRKGRGRKRRSRGWSIVFWIAVAVFVSALIGLGVIGWSYWSASNRYAEIADQAFEQPTEKTTLADMTVDWDALRKINPDIVGWIYIPGTVVNYPVVQTTDNEKYLNTNFDGATGLATGCGTIFLDCNDSKKLTDDNEIIYGHHRNDGTMFAALADFADQGTFDEHRTIYFLTPGKNYKLKTFSLIRTTGDDPLAICGFSSAREMAKYVKDKEEKSLVTPSEGFPKPSSVKHIFTFATCDYNEENGRAVLFSRVVKTAVPHDGASDTVGTYVAATE